MNSLYKQIQELELNSNMKFIDFSYLYIYFQLLLFNKNLQNFNLQTNVYSEEQMINTLFNFLSFILFGTHQYYQVIHDAFYFIINRYKNTFNKKEDTFNKEEDTFKEEDTLNKEKDTFNKKDTYNFICQIFNTYFNIKFEYFTRLTDNTIYLSYSTNNNSFTPINLPITFFQLGFINKNNNNINDLKKWNFSYFKDNYETQINYLNDIFPILFEDNEIEFLKNNTMKLNTINGQGKVEFFDKNIHINKETQLFKNIKQQIIKSTKIIFEFWGFDINLENDDFLINPIVPKHQNKIDTNVIEKFEILANSKINCKLLTHILFCLQLFNLTNYSFAIILKIELTLINYEHFHILDEEYVEKYLKPCLNVPNLFSINRQIIMKELSLILKGKSENILKEKSTNQKKILKVKSLSKSYGLQDLKDKILLLDQNQQKLRTKNIKQNKQLINEELINNMDQITFNTAINELATSDEYLKFEKLKPKNSEN